MASSRKKNWPLPFTTATSVHTVTKSKHHVRHPLNFFVANFQHRRILAYLIPLRILKGHLPSAELLARFPVLYELFSPFIDAIRTGNLKAYDAALDKWESRLLELNLWLSLEKARELCVRCLFRRVWVWSLVLPTCLRSNIRIICTSWVASEKATRITIALFHAGLTVAGDNVSVEEAECLVANMIYKGYIRGYISHERQMVVLASTNAFPKVADRPNALANV